MCNSPIEGSISNYEQSSVLDTKPFLSNTTNIAVVRVNHYNKIEYKLICGILFQPYRDHGVFFIAGLTQGTILITHECGVWST